MTPDEIYLQLKGARERLCRVSLLQGALDRIALVERDLPAGGRHQEILRRQSGGEA